MLRGDGLHRLPGQHDRHPVPEPAQGDQAVLVDPPLHPGQPHDLRARLHHRRRWHGRDGTGFDDGLHAGPGSKLEPLDRGPHPQRLVRPEGVVLLDPDIQRGLQLLQGGVAAIMDAEELGTNRLVPALHLPCGGRRSGRGQQMPDTVLGADPVEQHLRRTPRRAEPAGEDFPIVSEDLLRDPVPTQRRQQRLAHRLRRWPAAPVWPTPRTGSCHRSPTPPSAPVPSARWKPPTTSICHSSIGRARSHRR